MGERGGVIERLEGKEGGETRVEMYYLIEDFFKKKERERNEQWCREGATQ